MRRVKTYHWHNKFLMWNLLQGLCKTYDKPFTCLFNLFNLGRAFFAQKYLSVLVAESKIFKFTSLYLTLLHRGLYPQNPIWPCTTLLKKLKIIVSKAMDKCLLAQNLVWTSCSGKYLRAIINVLKNTVVKIVIKTVFTLKTYMADKQYSNCEMIV